MTPAQEVRDSAALLEILDWISAMRSAENFEFVINQTWRGRGERDIVMPDWLFQLLMADLEVYAIAMLKQRGIAPPPRSFPDPPVP